MVSHLQNNILGIRHCPFDAFRIPLMISGKLHGGYELRPGAISITQKKLGKSSQFNLAWPLEG